MRYQDVNFLWSEYMKWNGLTSSNIFFLKQIHISNVNKLVKIAKICADEYFFYMDRVG